MSEYLSALTGAISSFAIGAAVYFGQLRYARWGAAMNIIAEFNSLAWLTLRNQLQEDLTRHHDPAVLGKPASEEFPSDARDRIWALLAFYARLSVMFDGKFVARKPVFLTFGEVFAWWYEFSLKYLPGLEETSEMKHARALNTLFEIEARRLHKGGVYAGWRQRGKDARASLGLAIRDGD